ncbi:MAG TPA: TetR/AcrR family transcriptional regulator [Solirubrobacterales bacterium]|nr:TetR/AcrR family transcriptional regulator [Solirubrobacterales bacterium]
MGPSRRELDGLIEREHLPAGRHDLTEPLVAHSQRERILVAMSQSCARKGFGATTISDIVGPAGVSRATFYELFEDKEDCFQAAMELSLADAMERVVGAFSPEKPWTTLVRDSAAAFLDLLASRPAFARMALVEAPASGQRAFEMYAAGKRVLLTLLDRGREEAIEAGIPASAARAAIAGAESLVVGQILAGNAKRLRELLPDVVYIMIVPYRGQEEALRHSRELGA